MRRETIFWLAAGGIVAGVLAGAGYGAYRLGMAQGVRMAGLVSAAADADSATPGAGDIDPATGRRVLYWHDPMVPGRRFDRPGKSPFMNMMLVPVYADGDGDGGVAVSARTQQNLGVRTVEVVREVLAPRVEAAGSIVFNERDQVAMEARAAAFVERLHVRATLDRVATGQAIVDLYVPEWIAVQEELLTLKRMSRPDLEPLVDAARQRMRLAGMTDAQIEIVEETAAVQPRITLAAPIGGVLVEIGAREGMTVMPGETLYRINGLATVWADAAVPEGQARTLRPGVAVEARASALPGDVFRGTLQAVLPEVDPVTRTIKARFELANPDGRLAPGMFVAVAFQTDPAERLTVPTEAVIRTGRREVVIVVDESTTFRIVDVETGVEVDGRTEVTRGLEAGQRVVESGQFLIDSEASLRGASMRMEGAPAPAGEERP